MRGGGSGRGLGVVHRLDKDTSGLIVFARTADAKRILAMQFRAHDIERVYHAIAHGEVAAKRVETHLVTDRGDGIRGSYGHFRRPRGGIPPEAKRSVTHVRRSLRSRVRPWSSAAGNRAAAPDPHPPVRARPSLVGNACISAITRAQRSNRRARCSTRAYSDSCIPNGPAHVVRARSTRRFPGDDRIASPARG